jgi:outer membrane protein assembly factor BamB
MQIDASAARLHGAAAVWLPTDPMRTPLRQALLLLVLAFAVITPSAATAGPAGEWPAYLHDARHTSTSTSAAITPANAGALTQAWTFTSRGPTMTGQPGRAFVASPVVSGGRVFIGSNTGVFYALDSTTGHVAWSRFLGFSRKLTCNARGIASTATVAVDPVTSKPTVYVSSGDGYLFALDAATGTVVWKSEIRVQSPGVNDYFDWSSPTVANGSVYVGVSAQCDAPLVRAGVKRFDQATGALRADYFTVPEGQIGGSVWSSVAANPKAIFATTGNASAGISADAYALVKLDPTTLVRTAKYTVPGADRVPDSDFGASPVLFSGGGVQMVGACNKGGFFYALRASDMSFRWKLRVAKGSSGGSTACLAAGVWDGSRLFLSGPLTTIGGVDYRGSVRRVDPATGATIWARGLPGVVVGTPSVNGAGLIAAPIFEFDSSLSGTYLLDAATGAIVRFLPGGTQFAQPTFAGSYLFTASQSGGVVTAWKLP